jgi:hypothetical protein
VPDDPVGDPGTIVRGIRITDAIAHPHLAALFVQQVDGERVEGNQARDQVWNLLEQFVQIDHGRHLASQVEQRQQDVAFVRA